MSEELSPQDAQAAAAQLQADVGMQHVAKVYAEAIFAAAEGAGQTEAVLSELDAVVVEVLDRHPAMEEILASELVSHEEKLGILDRVLGGAVSPILLDSLKVISHHGRLGCLRAIHQQLHVLFDESRGRVPVQLSTAAAVDEALAARLSGTLQKLLGAKPVLTRSVEPGLIGGAVIRVGDTVYDGSIATQLQNVRQQMIDRSVHEIQSRRDRFRYPAGN